MGRVGWMLAAALTGGVQGAAAHAEDAVPAIVGDAIPASLTGVPGDPVRGRVLVVGRQAGLCLLCHSGPFDEERQQGTLAPDLAGAGARWTEGQLRLRLVAPRRVFPDSIMPSYLATDGRVRLAAPWQGRPLLDPQQIEDVVALLLTLRDPR